MREVFKGCRRLVGSPKSDTIFLTSEVSRRHKDPTKSPF